MLLGLLLQTAAVANGLPQVDLPILHPLISTGQVIGLTLELTNHTTKSGFWMHTRALNGIVPGPTLRLKAGDSLVVNFTNLLPDQGRNFSNNHFSAPDASNLHYHGFHDSGELPSDDVTVPVAPGGNRTYETHLISTHMPGTHWIHTHRHGSTLLQVGGGAAGAIIIEDEASTKLPEFVKGAPEVPMVISQMKLSLVDMAKKHSNDTQWQWHIPPDFPYTADDTWLMFNGEIAPTIRINAGEWTRFRMVYNGWMKGLLDLDIHGCDMVLLAKDGIYINDFPRNITKVRIVPAGRADVMVRCPEANTTYLVDGFGQTNVSYVTTGSAAPPNPLPEFESGPFNFTFPDYIQDLQTYPVNPNCSCKTKFGYLPDGPSINEIQFNLSYYSHTYGLGEVVERNVTAVDHPYHQHIWPFQMISGWDNLTQYAYYNTGDWHDTIQGVGVLRHNATRFETKVMIHCHRLQHEDLGMMTMERSFPAGYGCQCAGENFTHEEIKKLDMGAVVSGVVGGLAAVTLGGAAVYIYKRNKKLGGGVDSI